MRLREWIVWLCLGGALQLPLVGCDAHASSQEIVQIAVTEAGVRPGCVQLQSCCPMLPSDVLSSCTALATQANDTECETLLSALRGGGRCAVALDAAVPRDASVALDAGTAPRDAAVLDAGVTAVACTLLQACCTSPALPSSQTMTCELIDSTNDETQCSGLLKDLTSSQSCGAASAVTGTCLQLQGCCGAPSFPVAFGTACMATVSEGLNPQCGSDLQSFVAAGYCDENAGDGGHPEDPSCTTLGTCCSEVSFPANLVNTCEDIVHGNEGGNCLSAYDSYVGLAYCE